LNLTWCGSPLLYNWALIPWFVTATFTRSV